MEELTLAGGQKCRLKKFNEMKMGEIRPLLKIVEHVPELAASGNLTAMLDGLAKIAAVMTDLAPDEIEDLTMGDLMKIANACNARGLKAAAERMAGGIPYPKMGRA